MPRFHGHEGVDFVFDFRIRRGWVSGIFVRDFGFFFREFQYLFERGPFPVRPFGVRFPNRYVFSEFLNKRDFAFGRAGFLFEIPIDFFDVIEFEDMREVVEIDFLGDVVEFVVVFLRVVQANDSRVVFRSDGQVFRHAKKVRMGKHALAEQLDPVADFAVESDDSADVQYLLGPDGIEESDRQYFVFLNRAFCDIGKEYVSQCFFGFARYLFFRGHGIGIGICAYGGIVAYFGGMCKKERGGNFF
jgi:hypothetical protein